MRSCPGLADGVGSGQPLLLQRIVSWADEREELVRMPDRERALGPLLTLCGRCSVTVSRGEHLPRSR